MKILVSEKLSEHKYKTPEGYLICTDAILARTGKQTYTKDEVFGDGDNTEIDIDRPYDQVMNEKTIASFENKPVTFDHPEEDVNVGNYKSYAVGYVRDVHQGKADGKDVILGNLVITDQDAINAIESGEHTDLSCGYDCDIKDDGNGGYSQNNIRGNHVALCKEGRAGMARIVDSKTHAFSRIRDSYVIEELPEDETVDIYIPILKKYNLKIQKLSGNKVKVIGNRNDIVRYYDKEIGIDEDDIGIVDSKVVDQSVKDAEWSNDWANLDDLGIDDRDKKEVEAYFKKLASKYGVSYVRTTYGMYPCPIFRGDKKKLEKLIYNEYVGKDRSSAEEEYELIEDSIKDNDIHDSKEMTMSDAIKMLSIVDAYKKVKDASKDEWVIKNTGLAYEIWNQGRMIKKFPAKKLAVEWIHSRFPADKIVED